MPVPTRPDERQSYHVVFTTYATWLHGDLRGSQWRGGKHIAPNHELEELERRQCKHDEIRLSPETRRIVFDAILAEAKFYNWTIHALNVLDNHAHVLISVPLEVKPSYILARLKASATKALHEAGYFLDRKTIWTFKGRVDPIKNEGHFWKTVAYIRYKQKWLPFDLEN